MNLGPTKYTEVGGTRGDQWRQDALCRDLEPELFFPEPTTCGNGAAIQRAEGEEFAKSLCAQCPVQTQCLSHALAHDERFGVWGGFSEAERRTMQRREQRKATA